MQLVFYESEAEEQTSPNIVKGAMKRLVSPREGSKNMTALLVKISQGGLVKEHNHESEEIYYVQSGEAKVTVDGNVSHVRRGATVLIPSNAKHEVSNSGNEPLVFFAVVSPPPLWSKAG